MTPAAAEILRLPDGRALGFSITGRPSGPPVFYCHGWPASRLEAALIDDLPARLIAIDRPGYGASSPQSGRRLRDFPADLAHLAAHLGLRRFHVVGVSGGAPFALACAASLDAVAGAALISPLPPLARDDAPADEALGRGLLRLRHLGEHAGLGFTVMAGVRLGIRAGLIDPQTAIDDAASPRDAECLTPVLRRQLIAAWHEGLREGVAGALSDAIIYAAPWNIALAAIARPVTIWHGAEDRVVPAATLGAYAALRADRRLLPGEGHYSVALTRTAEILSALLDPGKPAP